MNDEATENGPGVEPHSRFFTGRHLVVLGVIVLVVAFLVGLIPMWLRARQYAVQRDESRRELQISQRALRRDELERLIAAAVIDSRLGQYESARWSASEFFQAIQQEINVPATADLSNAQSEQLAPLLGQRDEIITLLARADPAAAERLTQIYVVTRKALQVK